MKVQNLSVKRLFGRVAIGLVLSMSGITIALFLVTKQTAVLLTGGALLLCALVGIFVLTQAFGKRLSQFTADLCQTLDHMIAGNEAPQRPEDSETQLARIGHRLARLYQIMQENRRRVDEERQELQTLVSDISHQVKTPVSNLKMATDTLLEKPMTEAERTDFIRGIRSQTDKLDFLFQALVKTSRLETGVIQLDKKPGRLFDTVAQAMSGIVYAAEKKEIAVSVDCPEDLTVFHDSKWTSEALFNLLDNAVKYTPAGGSIHVSVQNWEMYWKIDVTDTGRGIPEQEQATIFKRFYREEAVHEVDGIGIGLYLAREIITMQGGYIEAGVIPKFAACATQGVPWFQERGLWQDNSYEPRPGDIIFFDWDDGGQDGESDHVGIVEKVENGRVYTVEGNSGDSVRQNSYPIGYYEIYGYGTPAY